MYGKVAVPKNKGLFLAKYGDIALLISIEVDEQMIKAIMPYWDLHISVLPLTKRI